MESPEVVYPTFVRFKSFYNTDCCGRGPANSLRSENFLLGTYWEIGFGNISFAGMPVLNDQSHRKQIESGTQIMDCVSHQACPIVGNGISDMDAIDLISRLRLLLHDEGIGVTLKKGSDLGFKPLNMLLGPINLYPNSA
jgi:hypothetical protein